MYYLDYAKPVDSRYVLNFFADTIEDLKDVPTTTAYVTRNGTNYGIPLDTSVVTIVENGIRVNYVLQNGKYIVGGDIPPIVGTKTIIENGTYLAKDDDLEGYSSVTVEVPETVSEEKTVELDMASGDQTILPEEDKLLNKVVVKKPETLIAENIKDGVNIGGVVGNLLIPTNNIAPFIERSLVSIEPEDLANVTKIADYAFYYYKNLRSVKLPSSINTIGNSSFMYSGVSTLSAPNVDYFEELCFYDVKDLGWVSGGWSPTLKSIGNSAFENSMSYPSKFPATLEYIGTNAFYRTSWDGVSGRAIIFEGQMPDLIGTGEVFSYTQKIDCRNCTKIPVLQSTRNISWHGSEPKCIIPDSLYNDWINATNWASYTNVKFVKSSEA